MNTVVKTEYGEVRCSVTDGVHIFKGIPYAAPPFGTNRLRPPQPVAPWSGVRDAFTYGPSFSLSNEVLVTDHLQSEMYPGRCEQIAPIGTRPRSW